jgi:hypothetical protein
VITPEAIDKLKDELGRIFTVAKTHHYEQGQKYGHLASVIPESKYRLIIGDAAWTHDVPDDPGAYSQAALGAGNAAAQREQLVAEHKILQKSYNDYLCIEEAGKELILYAETIHRLRRHDGAWNDRPPSTQNSNQDDDGTEAQVQDNRIQQPMGSDNQHHRVLHAARPLPVVTGRSRNCNKRWRNRRGQSSRGTSPTSGWNANNVPRRRRNNCDSRRQCFLPKRQQQQRKKESHRQCYMRCYRSNTTNRLQRWQQQTRPTWMQ